MATLSLRKIDKIYDNNVQAVFDFNLEIKNKEFIVLVGPSGCGKSTTLRMIAGLEEITNGELYIDNKFVNTVMPKDRDIAMVFQNYALYPHMTVYKNIAFGLTIRKHPVPILDEKGNKIPVNDIDAIENLKKQVKKLNNEDGNHKEEIADLNKQIKYLETNKTAYKVKMVSYTNEEIDKAVRHAADILGLTKYLDRKPAALSGGQRQRVALGRAIVRQPKVFLMDEPLSNLDAKLRVQMRSEIIRIHNRVGATTVYVTHDQTEAMTMANRIVIMKDGWVQQIGTPDEVYNDPENVFVAGFIGSPAMNFFKGRYADGYFYFDGGKNLKIKLDKAQNETLKNFNNKNIILGVRPSDIYLKDDKENKHPSQSFSLKCEIKELLGDEIIVYGDVSYQRTAIKLKANKANVEQGDTRNYCFSADKMYFFELESTKRIRKGSKPTPENQLPKIAPKKEEKTEEPVAKKKPGFFARFKRKKK